MSVGGARNRSGPQADPNSARSDARGLTLTALPMTGFSGAVPDFPLPDESAREAEVWADAWRTPQAQAWSLEPWRWRTVAMWVRWSVRMEADDASAALGNVVVRFADQIGMTPAGLRENGWKVETQADQAAKAPIAPRKSSRDRLTVVPDVG